MIFKDMLVLDGKIVKVTYTEPLSAYLEGLSLDR
jgi:hypothetical protein